MSFLETTIVALDYNAKFVFNERLLLVSSIQLSCYMETFIHTGENDFCGDWSLEAEEDSLYCGCQGRTVFLHPRLC